MSVTGWAFDRYLFLGFLPRKKSDRTGVLQSVIAEPGPIVVYESPHRVRASLADVDALFSDRQLTICRELTKLHEEIFRGSASEALLHFTEPRGEFVVVIAGRGELPTEMVSDTEIIETLQALASDGLAGRTLVDRAVELTGAQKNRVYRLSLVR